jgi:FtsH-binding integral membrane protein
MMYSEYPIEAAGTLMRRVFLWMTAGLLVTGLVSYGVHLVPALQHAVATNSLVILLLVLAQFGLVLYLNFGLRSMSAETAVAAYLGYSVLTGMTLSVLLLLFTPASLALTFFVCAGMFATMALYGYFTRSDLSGMGTYLLMGLVGLVIAGLVNMFLHSSSMDFVISIIGVIIFTLLTAYDVQMVRNMGMVMLGNDEEMTKVSIICSLKLYLDFVNLFLYLLRFFGQKKD